MSTTLIDKLAAILAEYKALDAKLTEIDTLLTFADQKPDEIRVILRFSALGKSMEFPYPTQTAINQAENYRDKIVADMTAIEEKLEGALSDT